MFGYLGDLLSPCIYPAEAGLCPQNEQLPLDSYCHSSLSFMDDLLKVSKVSDVPFALELVPASLGSWALGTLLSGLR